MAFYKTKKNKRRVDRSTSGLQAELILYDDQEENVLAGPSVAYVNDISRFGAGLVLPKIRINNHHLYFEPNEKSYILYLRKNCPDGSRTLSIQVRPKWYRLEDDEGDNFFCLGIEFIKARNVDDISQLRDMARELDLPRNNWLSSIFSK